jgi:hypothetical protein
MMRIKLLFLSIFLGAIFVASAPSALGCATCFGASDSPMAQGMNWGIFSLLAVVVCMLSAVAGFFVFLAKKSAQFSASAAPQPHPLETNNV